MPFDGVAEIGKAAEIGIVSDELGFVSAWAGNRLRIRNRLRRWGRRRRPAVGLSPGAHYAAAAVLLEEAKSLIADRDRWLQGAYQRFFRRRCAIGALRAAAGKIDDVRVAQSAHALLLAVADSRRFTSVEGMNDHSSHADVIRAFDEAIALAWGKALTDAPGGTIGR
jgi:hypothetical protein